MPNTLIAWLKENNHWGGWAGFIVGALGLAAAVYYAQKDTGDITLKFTTVKIAQADVPGIKILDDSNNEIRGNVFGTEIVLWNTGELSLGEKSDRIRKPIVVTFSGDVKIVNAVVQGTRNVEPDSVSLDKTSNEVTVNWKQFDPGDAVKVFVIYEAKEQAKISFLGRYINTKLSDISEFKEEYPGESGLSSMPRTIEFNFRVFPWSTTFQAIGLIAQILVTLFMIVCVIFKRPRERYREFRHYLVIAMVGSIFFYFTGSAIQFFGGGTPF